MHAAQIKAAADRIEAGDELSLTVSCAEGWEDVSVLAENRSVSDLAAAAENGTTRFSWIADADGDEETEDDREVWIDGVKVTEKYF